MYLMIMVINQGVVSIISIIVSMYGISLPNREIEFSKISEGYTLYMETILRHHFMVLFLDFG